MRFWPCWNVAKFTLPKTYFLPFSWTRSVSATYRSPRSSCLPPVTRRWRSPKAVPLRWPRLAPHPLLLLDSGFGFRRAFDAACRLVGLTPKIRMESRSPHTLLALAEAGHGVAIIPSALRTHRYHLRVVGLTYSGKLLREPLSILWDKRRPLPRYATAFCDMWAEYVREVFPITRPSDAKGSGEFEAGRESKSGTSPVGFDSGPPHPA